MGPVRLLFSRFVVFPWLILLLQGLSFVKKSFVILFRFLVKRKAPSVVRTPEDRFKGLEAVGYTFKSNYVDLPIGGGKTLPRVHYIDEGPRHAKETILCLHGEPSWSFLYRNVVHKLVQAGNRVIVPDFIGFGKSDKFTMPEAYTHELHTLTLRLLLDHLSVRGVTLVCQDWGGKVGLSVVKDSPNLFSRLVIMNTNLPTGFHFSLSMITRITPFLFWRSFVQFFGTWIPVRHILRSALVEPTHAVLEGYAAPFPSSEYKAGAAKWPLLVPLTSHSPVAVEMQATRDFLKLKWKKPVLVMFSDGDLITKGEDQVFLELLPKAVTKTIQGARHFLQEDKSEEVASHIIAFVDDKL